MSETPPDHQVILNETQRQQVTRNLELLEMQLVTDNLPQDLAEAQLQQLRDELAGIGIQGALAVPGGRQTAVYIVYETATGAIHRLPRQFRVGEQSMIRTWLEEKGNRRRLLLKRTDPHMPTPREYSAAVAGRPALIPDNSIRPARLDPTMGTEQVGREEPWGRSRFTPNATGDLVIRQALEQFNNNFGK